MWVIVMIFFLVGISKVAQLGFRKIMAVNVAKNIPRYLEHPDSFEIHEIKTYVLKDKYKFTHEGKITEESEEIDQVFGNRPVINYCLYTATDNILGRARYETFIFVDGKAIASFGTDTYNATLKDPFDLIFKDYESLMVSLATTIYEGVEYDVDITVALPLDVERYDKLNGHLMRMLFSFVIALVIQFLVSVFTRQDEGQRQSNAAAAIEKLIDSAYPASTLPQSYKTFKVNKKNCHVWIQTGDLCLMQTKASMKKKARKNLEQYDSAAKIKGGIFFKKINISSITNIAVIEEKGCVVNYQERGEMKTLNFSLNAQGFVEGLREHLKINSVFAAGGKAFE
jgi:hypothetical protein